MREKDKIIRLSKFSSKFFKECRFKGCVFPDKTYCSKNVIKSHSIQKNKILNYIADNGMIITYVPRISTITVNFEEIGINSASTFFGFCGYHDSKVFSNIENEDYNETSEQNFLYAYRACAREYGVKHEATCYYQKLASDYRLFPARVKELYYYLVSSQQGLIDMQDHLNKFNKELRKIVENRNYNLLTTLVFKLPYESLIAVNSIFNLIYDFHGHILNDLSKLSENLKPLFLNIFPQNGKTIIILSCYTSDFVKFKGIFSQLNTYNHPELENFFSQLILIYCENIFLSPQRWKNLSEGNRKLIVSFFKKTMNAPPSPNCLSAKASINLFQLLKK